MTEKKRFPVPAAILLGLAAVILAALAGIKIHLSSGTLPASIVSTSPAVKSIGVVRQGTKPEYFIGYVMNARVRCEDGRTATVQFLNKKERMLPRTGAQVELIEEDGKLILKDTSKWYVYEIYLTRFFFMCLIVGLIRSFIRKPAKQPAKNRWASDHEKDRAEKYNYAGYFGLLR